MHIDTHVHPQEHPYVCIYTHNAYMLYTHREKHNLDKSWVFIECCYYYSTCFIMNLTVSPIRVLHSHLIVFIPLFGSWISTSLMNLKLKSGLTKIIQKFEPILITSSITMSFFYIIIIWQLILCQYIIYYGNVPYDSA